MRAMSAIEIPHKMDQLRKLVIGFNNIAFETHTHIQISFIALDCKFPEKGKEMQFFKYPHISNQSKAKQSKPNQTI